MVAGEVVPRNNEERLGLYPHLGRTRNHLLFSELGLYIRAPALKERSQCQTSLRSDRASPLSMSPGSTMSSYPGPSMRDARASLVLSPGGRTRTSQKGTVSCTPTGRIVVSSSSLVYPPEKKRSTTSSYLQSSGDGLQGQAQTIVPAFLFYK